MVSSCDSLQLNTALEEEELDTIPVEEQVIISVVYDNYSVNPDLSTGWGFGCVIRTPGETVLFDTGGDSKILLSNMETMDIDPEDIDTVVISHIHGDHTGGLSGFLGTNSAVTVYIPASFPDSWREGIKSQGAEYKDVGETMQISQGIYSTGEMGTSTVEQSLIVDTDQGLVVITGCAHPGILNIVGRSQEILRDSEIYLCMGGFHLSGSSPSELSSIVQGFRETGVHKVAPSHCSGDKCRQLFEKKISERLHT